MDDQTRGEAPRETGSRPMTVKDDAHYVMHRGDSENCPACQALAGSVNDLRRALGVDELPHQHRWIPVIAVGDGSYSSTRYVMFGCECGEALRSVAVDHPASRFKELVHAAILEGSRIDPKLVTVDSNVKKLIETLARLERAWSELPE